MLHVTVLALLVGAARAAADAQCNGVGCCCFGRDSRLVKVNCDMQGRPADIEAHCIPTSAREVRIIGGTVTIFGSSLERLKRLKSLKIEDVKSLNVLNNDMTAVPAGLSITIRNASRVQFFPTTFFNWQGSGPTIKFEDVAELSFRKKSFGLNSTVKKLHLENVKAIVDVDGEGFQDIINELVIKGTTGFGACKKGVLKGRFRSLRLESVDFSTVERGCFDARGRLEKLTIKSCTLGEVKEGGFVGNFRKGVRIEDSKASDVRTGAFNLTTSSFVMKSNDISELEERSLVVHGEKISLDDINVDSLRTDAIIDLRTGSGYSDLQNGHNRPGNGFTALALTKSHADNKKTVPKGTAGSITITSLSANAFEDGSLRFAQPDTVTLKDLRSKRPCKCDIHGEVHKLVGESHISETDEEVVDLLLPQLYREFRCVANNSGHESLSLNEHHCWHCNPAEDDIRCHDLRGQCGPVCTILPISMALILLIMVFLGIYVFTGFRQRRKRPQHTTVSCFRGLREACSSFCNRFAPKSPSSGGVEYRIVPLAAAPQNDRLPPDGSSSALVTRVPRAGGRSDGENSAAGVSESGESGFSEGSTDLSSLGGSSSGGSSGGHADTGAFAAGGEGGAGTGAVCGRGLIPESGYASVNELAPAGMSAGAPIYSRVGRTESTRSDQEPQKGEPPIYAQVKKEKQMATANGIQGGKQKETASYATGMEQKPVATGGSSPLYAKVMKRGTPAGNGSSPLYAKVMKRGTPAGTVAHLCTLR